MAYIHDDSAIQITGHRVVGLLLRTVTTIVLNLLLLFSKLLQIIYILL